jgi:hypothetical protein
MAQLHRGQVAWKLAASSGALILRPHEGHLNLIGMAAILPLTKRKKPARVRAQVELIPHQGGSDLSSTYEANLPRGGKQAACRVPGRSWVSLKSEVAIRWLTASAAGAHVRFARCFTVVRPERSDGYRTGDRRAAIAFVVATRSRRSDSAEDVAAHDSFFSLLG